ncbi:hypothetical protein Tco_0624608 [Tanacetum coccineum]|uniref:Uncharacterized protein n=1 Tax=Tanacetum coccineum TaxID=301880 RepID=A0ABQ4WEE7_9ASTR
MEIAKDAKLIKIKDQLLVLIKRQVKIELMLEEKFRDLCEEVSNFVKEIKDVVNKMMVNESYLSVREKHTIVSKMNLGAIDELAIAANTWGLFDGMLMYCGRENAKDLEFANGFHNLWAELLERTNEKATIYN